MRSAPCTIRQHVVFVAILLIFARTSRAGGVGISETPDGSVGATQTSSVQFNYYRVPEARSVLAHRDIEFWWSDGYTSRSHPLVPPGNPSTNDLDRVGQSICDVQQNALRISSSDIRLVHDFLGFTSATYDVNPLHNGFLVAGIPNPPDAAHIDSYNYVPQVGADLGDDSSLRNRGASPSDWLSAFEDTSSGHPVGEIDGRNNLSYPGPAPAQVGQVSPTAWHAPDQLGNWEFDHEFQHTLNGRLPSVYLSEYFSGITEAIVGEAQAPPRFDAPHKWGMLRGDAFGPGAGLNNYAAYRDFGAYLAYNYRGMDTTASLAGVADDLARRWAKGGSPPAGDDRSLYGLRNRLSDSECAECPNVSLFAGLGPHDRLQALLHAWRVAAYARNDTLQRGLSRRYGPFGYVGWMGYDQAATVGFFQNIDGIASDDTLNIPADTTLGAWALRKSVIFEHRHRVYTPQGTGIVPTFPTTDLVPLGAEYFVVHSDSTIAASNQDLVVRLTPMGSWFGDVPNFPAGHGAGRMMMAVIGYNGPRDVLALRNELWKHPDFARVVTPFRAVDADSVGGSIEAVLPAFGSTYPAAVVVLSMVDGPDGAAESQPHLDVRPIPFALSLRLRTSTTDTTGATLVARSAGYWDDFPAWSPDGNQIAYTSTIPAMATNSQVFTISAGGGGTPTLLGAFAGHHQFLPDWSPRGDAIVFVDVDESTFACNLADTRPNGRCAERADDGQHGIGRLRRLAHILAKRPDHRLCAARPRGHDDAADSAHQF